MATTPTQLPVPSETTRDIKFNAGKIDEFVTSTEAKYVDRLGGEHYTVDGIRQNLIPLSRQYMTLAEAQADIANIPSGTTTYVRNADGSSLADEYINNDGTLESTGRKMPSQQAVDDVNSVVASISGMISQNEIPESLHDFSDEDGFIGAQVQINEKGVGFSSESVSLLPEVLENLLLKLSRSETNGFEISDEDGHVIASFVDGISKALGMTITYDWTQKLVSLFSKTLNLDSDGFTFTLTPDGSDIFTLTDQEGFVFLRITSDFKLITTIDTGGGGSGAVTGDAAARNANNISLITAAIRQRFYLTQMPVADINVFITYGQSFSVGTYSVVPLSTDNKYGNLMLGGSPRGMNYDGSASNMSNIFGPLGGGNILTDLVEVRQDNDGNLSDEGNYGETPLSGWLNFSKLLHNQRRGEINDMGRIFAGACCGVGGRSILQLSKGGNPDYYNHAITAMQGIKDAADAAGKTSRLCGILWMQGENDGTTPYSTYYSRLDALYNNLVADGMQIFGNEFPPAWYNYQPGGTYASDSNELGVSRALLDHCENHEGLVFFVNPVGQLPNPMNGGSDNHMFANSYRWFGCDVAKITDLVHQGSGRPVFRMRNATYKENKVLIDFTPPVPPLKFRDAYTGSTATLYEDKGFTVRDGLGNLYGADISVSIVKNTVIQITASRNLVAPVNIWLGDRSYHAGVHNIADSDTSLSNSTWEIVTGSPAAESISELNGKPYQLVNWCGSDVITATEES